MARIGLPNLATAFGLWAICKRDTAWGVRLEGDLVVRYADSLCEDEVAEAIVRFGLQRRHGAVDEALLAKELRAFGYPYRRTVQKRRLLRLCAAGSRSTTRQKAVSQFVAAE